MSTKVEKEKNMDIDEEDLVEVTCETFKNYHKQCELYAEDFKSLRKRRKDSHIVELDTHAHLENHRVMVKKILRAEHITEDVIETLEQYTLRSITEDELISVIVNLITRFRKPLMESEDEKVHLFHVLAGLNSTRLLLVILSKEYVVKEFMCVYRRELWQYLLSYLKFLTGLMRVSPSSFLDKTVEIVHLFGTLGCLFHEVQLDDETCLQFEHHLLQLYFTRTRLRVNVAVREVIAEMIVNYGLLELFLSDILSHDKSSSHSTNVYPIIVDSEQCNIHIIPLLLLRVIDLTIDFNIEENIQESVKTIFHTVDTIVRRCLELNVDCLVTVIKDLNKISAVQTGLAHGNMILLYYYLLLNIRQRFVNNKILNVSKNAVLIDAYVAMMSEMCGKFKLYQDQCKHLDISPDLIYELLDIVDREEQFTLVCLKISSSVLTGQTFNQEDQEILTRAKIKFKADKPKKKPKKETTESSTKKRILIDSIREHNLARCYNYYIYERLKEAVLVFSLPTLVNKLKTPQAQSIPRIMDNLKTFLDENSAVLDQAAMEHLTPILYYLGTNSERKGVPEKAFYIICLMASRNEIVKERIMPHLCKQLKLGTNVQCLKTQTDFLLDIVNDDTKDTPKVKRDQNLIIHTLLRRFKNQTQETCKPVILEWFSKLWFKLDGPEKLEGKVEQMIEAMSSNLELQFESLMKEFLDKVDSLGNNALLGVKQIVDYILKHDIHNRKALTIVLHVSNSKPYILLDTFPLLIQKLEDFLTQNLSQVDILKDILVNLLTHHKEAIRAEDWKKFEQFVLPHFNEITFSFDATIQMGELAHFCALTEEMQVGFFKNYEKLKLSLGRLQQNADARDEKMLLKYFCALLYLCTWLHNWPELIIKCADHIHITLVEAIFKLFYQTKKAQNRQKAVLSLGKLHSAFPELIDTEKVTKPYEEVLKHGDDNLKYLVVKNINDHLEKINKIGTAKTKRKSVSLIAMDSKLTDEITLIANRYKTPVLEVYFQMKDSRYRAEVAKFLQITLKCGALSAHQVAEEVIAMLTDSDKQTAENMFQELKHCVQLNDTLLLNNLRKGILSSYKLQKLLISNEERLEFWPSGYDATNNGAFAKIRPIFELAGKKSDLFLKILVSVLKDCMTEQNMACFAYLVENINTLQYSTLSQLRVVLYQVNSIVEDKASHLLDQYGTLNTEDKTKVENLFLKMTQVGVLLHMKSFLSNKYGLPTDFLRNKRFVNSKVKPRINAAFDQMHVLSGGLKSLLESQREKSTEKHLSVLSRVPGLKDVVDDVDTMSEGDSQDAISKHNLSCDMTERHQKTNNAKQSKPTSADKDNGSKIIATKPRGIGTGEDTTATKPRGIRTGEDICKEGNSRQRGTVQSLPDKIHEIAKNNVQKCTREVRVVIEKSEIAKANQAATKTQQEMKTSPRAQYPQIVQKMERVKIDWGLENSIQVANESRQSRVHRRVSFNLIKTPVKKRRLCHETMENPASQQMDKYNTDRNINEEPAFQNAANRIRRPNEDSHEKQIVNDTKVDQNNNGTKSAYKTDKHSDRAIEAVISGTDSLNLKECSHTLLENTRPHAESVYNDSSDSDDFVNGKKRKSRSVKNRRKKKLGKSLKTET